MSPLQKRLFRGATGGWIATIPMSLVMAAFQSQIRPPERESLPPKQITDKMLEKVNLKEDLEPETRNALTVLSHFAYGTSVGAAYALLLKPRRASPALLGMGHGLAVWAGSYLGWLPAVGLFPPAPRRPDSQNAMMIASHLVWCATLGALTPASPRRQPPRPRPGSTAASARSHGPPEWACPARRR